MNPNEVLRIVDALHRDKNIDPEIVFRAIEAAFVTAVRRKYGEEAEIEIRIDRSTGEISGNCNGNSENQCKIETLQFGGALHVHDSVELLGTEGRVRELNSQRSAWEIPLVNFE